jgi:cell fate (sporulation/competence/biofilm development) regulator YlbF (YheA/YmcA/DUF963 family)
LNCHEIDFRKEGPVDLLLNADSAPTTTKIDPLQAARMLGELLSQAPEYHAFLEALKTVNNDLTIQNLSAEIRAQQTADEIVRIKLEMEDLAAMKAYRQAEREVSALFRAVDEIISQEAGVAFVINAQRSGCGCSG